LTSERDRTLSNGNTDNRHVSTGPSALRFDVIVDVRLWCCHSVTITRRVLTSSRVAVQDARRGNNFRAIKRKEGKRSPEYQAIRSPKVCGTL